MRFARDLLLCIVLFSMAMISSFAASSRADTCAAGNSCGGGGPTVINGVPIADYLKNTTIPRTEILANTRDVLSRAQKSNPEFYQRLLEAVESRVWHKVDQPLIALDPSTTRVPIAADSSMRNTGRRVFYFAQDYDAWNAEKKQGNTFHEMVLTVLQNAHGIEKASQDDAYEIEGLFADGKTPDSSELRALLQKTGFFDEKPQLTDKVGVVRICEIAKTYSESAGTKCQSAITGFYYDPHAVDLCRQFVEAEFRSRAAQCVKAITNKTFLPEDLDHCGSAPEKGKILRCLIKRGSPAQPSLSSAVQMASDILPILIDAGKSPSSPCLK